MLQHAIKVRTKTKEKRSTIEGWSNDHLEQFQIAKIKKRNKNENKNASNTQQTC